MKNKILLVVAAIMAIFVTGCGSSGYTEISYKELQNKVANEETIVLFIGRETCSACTVFKGILKKQYKGSYAKQATIYYIDLDKLSNEETVEFNSTYYFSATPTVAILTNGKFSNIDTVTGSNKYSELIEMMKRKGILNGD